MKMVTEEKSNKINSYEWNLVVEGFHTFPPVRKMISSIG